MKQADTQTLSKIIPDGSVKEKISLVIKSVFGVGLSEIYDIEIIKKGITNQSFTFFANGRKYIMRIPGPETGKFIDRKEEALIYRLLNGKGICENVVYIDPDTGYKIAEYVDNAHNCGHYDFEEISKCMRKLRSFHEMKLSVENTYDLFYGRPPRFDDYFQTKETSFSLKNIIDSYSPEYCLTHIDPNPDNFIIYTDSCGNEQIRLIDWEYAAMQDPYVDIAMFSVYAVYNEQQIEDIIDAYFYDGITEKDKLKLYCYIAVCALNFSNWYGIKNDDSFDAVNEHLYNTAKKYYGYAVNNSLKYNKGGSDV